MRVLLIGADGQLGTDLQKVLDKKDLIPLTVSELDISKQEQIEEVFSKYRPQGVINTAAFHRTEVCEAEVEKAFLINAVAVKYLADACKNVDATLVHISTDYVFDGEKKGPYTEEDVPNPASLYGISKLAGEFCARYTLQKHFVIRTSGLYGTAGCMGKGGGNFVENRIEDARRGKKLCIVDDEILTPTYTLDLAAKIAQLIKTNHYGLYHITSHGQCSWFEFTQKIFALTGIKAEVEPIKGRDLLSQIFRPKYSVLKNQQLARLGMDDLRTWDQALKAYLQEKGHL